ncbi:hypothetical protein F5B20DRAFT_540809 [Whalleya microplaca]|nr:hypothetical protein F5B20DRAFT_540809 [Whalleya microplaca]
MIQEKILVACMTMVVIIISLSTLFNLHLGWSLSLGHRHCCIPKTEEGLNRQKIRQDSSSTIARYFLIRISDAVGSFIKTMKGWARGSVQVEDGIILS